MIRQYDIIGIQESRTDDCDIISIPGYNAYSNNRERLSRRKSGGIVLLVKKQLQKFVKVETRSYSKLVLWCTISKELMLTNNDLHCGAVYIPPISSKYANDDPFSELQREIIRYCMQSSQIILMGDFNSRTGNKDDLLFSDDFLAEMHGLEFLENENREIRDILRYSIPVQRENCDKTVNAYGTQMTEFCRLSNLSIVNGRIGRNTQNAKYTCKNKSVIDYFICSPTLFKLMRDFSILEFSNLYSDVHCPISLNLQIRHLNYDKESLSNAGLNTKLWNPDKGRKFYRKF